MTGWEEKVRAEYRDLLDPTWSMQLILNPFCWPAAYSFRSVPLVSQSA